VDLDKPNKLTNMPHTYNISDEILAVIAEQLGTHISQLVSPDLLDRGSVEIMESFPIWTLGLDSVGAAFESGVDIQELASPTGRWHHQIRLGDSVTAFARSMPLGPSPNDWSVREVFASPIAAKIDNAIEWVDKISNYDPLVRLLIVPAYNTHAFWLTDNDYHSTIIIIDSPYSNYDNNQYHAMSSKEFIEYLFNREHIIGIRH